MSMISLQSRKSSHDCMRKMLTSNTTSECVCLGKVRPASIWTRTQFFYFFPFKLDDQYEVEVQSYSFISRVSQKYCIRPPETGW